LTWAPCAAAADGRLIGVFAPKVNPFLLRRNNKDPNFSAGNPVAGTVFL
jgi:hypothetical protein